MAENLIYRFATRLEFGRKTEQVAHDAVRLVQRMDKDWMTTGRRPSGICGACLILAARMNNFRRSVREVVYIVKVTDATINQRLEEFKVTPSSNLTVDQFRIIDLESSYEPPAFYGQKKGKNKKKRKRGEAEAAEEEEDDEEEAGDRSTTENAVPSTDGTSQSQSTQPVRRDKDGYAIPALPIPIDPSLIAASAQAYANLDKNPYATPEPTAPTTDEPPAETTSDEPTPKRPRGRPRKDSVAPDPGPSLTTPADLAVEAALETEISQYLSDPSTTEHLAAYTTALDSARALSTLHRPDAGIPDSSEIADTEFDDDPEVAHCVLSAEEVAIKERIWVHENRDYLREQQRKLLKAQLEERFGTKRVIKRRNRKKRIGEGGEGSGASTPAEAIANSLRRRGFSKKINYGAIERAFEGAGSRILGNGAAGGVVDALEQAGAEVAVPEAVPDEGLTAEKSGKGKERARNGEAREAPTQVEADDEAAGEDDVEEEEEEEEYEEDELPPEEMDDDLDDAPHHHGDEDEEEDGGDEEMLADIFAD